MTGIPNMAGNSRAQRLGSLYRFSRVSITYVNLELFDGQGRALTGLKSRRDGSHSQPQWPTRVANTAGKSHSQRTCWIPQTLHAPTWRASRGQSYSTWNEAKGRRQLSIAYLLSVFYFLILLLISGKGIALDWQAGLEYASFLAATASAPPASVAAPPISFSLWPSQVTIASTSPPQIFPSSVPCQSLIDPYLVFAVTVTNIIPLTKLYSASIAFPHTISPSSTCAFSDITTACEAAIAFQITITPSSTCASSHIATACEAAIAFQITITPSSTSASSHIATACEAAIAFQITITPSSTSASSHIATACEAAIAFQITITPSSTCASSHIATACEAAIAFQITITPSSTCASSHIATACEAAIAFQITHRPRPLPPYPAHRISPVQIPNTFIVPIGSTAADGTPERAPQPAASYTRPDQWGLIFP
ncbi:hypothetical protein VOLCADRAFT_89339 [Volvox carteri f. nagariensis]|uniref:Uncharacterized protein n=1 Tax=Volvox carteri f. nagariensis TaxID=3068 RepID=D8TRG2_VOLCA|nr:uncharacterized protein VOLCADRAFT_89339 [Volvox carteri f. nagariensis]EFJ49987.1 hypothetical protein VOLCADRAFT_89339 [Volvox carteri f. nagariensis]|eukprot:XP_002949052.1 hypothetical protein VOLCADRAFT_89339 [Volvox carteri f. nagariensis]